MKRKERPIREEELSEERGEDKIVTPTEDKDVKKQKITNEEEDEEDNVQITNKKFKIIEKTGNLFETEDEALAHCVSRDFHMNKGIAREFRTRYKKINELKAQNKQIGDVAYLKCNEKFLFYLITKERYFHKPTYEKLRESLIHLRDLMISLELNRLSIPMIGCGLDKLKWKLESNSNSKGECVFDMIIDVFKDTDIIVTVFYFNNNNNNNNKVKRN